MTETRTDMLYLGDIRFDPQRNTLEDKEGKTVALRPQSVDVLGVLAAHAGTVVSKDSLLEEVWGDIAVTDDSLTQCIADIRRTLEDSDHKIVQTVPKKGYRLVAGAAVAQPRKPFPVLAGLAAFALLAIFGAWQFNARFVEDAAGGQAFMAPEIRRSEPSIAVLPFESIDNEERWIRMGRGLAADIAGELALNGWLYVSVPESLINVAFGDVSANHQIDARFALGGTIRAQGDDIRISAHLTDVTTREVLWSETWTESQEEIFGVQDRIVARIGSSLASTYSGVVVQNDLKRAKRKLTSSLDAYEHYLIAFETFHRFDSDTYPDVIRHLETALELDPNFAGALVTLSVVQRVLADIEEGEASKLWFEASQAAAYRAYSIDPNNPNVLWNVACAFALDGQMEIAGKTLHRAVAVAPNNADVLMISAGYSSLVGIGGEEPLAWARRALELNPLAPAWWYSDLGSAAFGAGEYDLASESMKRAPKTSGTTWLIMALSEALRGNIDEAREAAGKFRELAPHQTIEEFAGGTEVNRPDMRPMFEAARLLELPVTDEELRLANSR